MSLRSNICLLLGVLPTRIDFLIELKYAVRLRLHLFQCGLRRSSCSPSNEVRHRNIRWFGYILLIPIGLQYFSGSRSNRSTQ